MEPYETQTQTHPKLLTVPQIVMSIAVVGLLIAIWFVWNSLQTASHIAEEERASTQVSETSEECEPFERKGYSQAEKDAAARALLERQQDVSPTQEESEQQTKMDSLESRQSGSSLSEEEKQARIEALENRR